MRPQNTTWNAVNVLTLITDKIEIDNMNILQ